MYVCPARAHRRRHSCNSHSPPTFFSNRMPPPTPPSLVKFSVRARSLRIGAAVSMPTRLQVPLLMYALAASRPGTAATALAVSCVPTAITGTGVRQPRPRAHVGQQVAQDRAGRDDRRQDLRGQIQRAQHAPSPSPRARAS